MRDLNSASEPAGRARGARFLWESRGRAVRGPKPGLSLERIVKAAVAIADADGIEAVSMQRVAKSVGFATMAIYRYLPGKTELVSAMIDSVIGEPPELGHVTGGWRARLEEWARRAESVYRQHPWALKVSAADRVIGPNELGWVEAGVAALADTGLVGEEKSDAVLAVSGHVRNWAHYTSDVTGRHHPGTAGRWMGTIREMASQHRDRYPTLHAVLAADQSERTETGQEFGLRCVLDGIEMRVRERSGRSPLP